MGWLNELLPDNEQWDRFTTTLISAKDKIGDQLQIGKLIAFFSHVVTVKSLFFHT